MMQQYLKIKQANPDCLLFFRLGDFYELFQDDAKIGAHILGITLTSRDGTIPMAGVPYHAVDTYLNKLIQAGYKVAICEQVSEPGKTKLVEREVIRIVTPGTVLDDRSLERKENNYLVAIEWQSNVIGLAYADLSTAEFRTTEFANEQDLCNELTRLRPAECLISPLIFNQPEKLAKLKRSGARNLVCEHRWELWQATATTNLQKHFHIKSLRSFGLHDRPAATIASAIVLAYLQETQKQQLRHLHNLVTYQTQQSLQLDSSTINNLELFHSLQDGKKENSFFHCLDHTLTPMGGRRLQSWIRQPLQDKQAIENRLECVAWWKEQSSVRVQVRELLRSCSDVDRVLSRIALGQGTGPRLIQLQQSLEIFRQIRKVLSQQKADALTLVSLEFLQEDIETIANLIAEQIRPDALTDTRGGGLIREGVDPQLDELRQIVDHSRDWIHRLEKEERAKTGITSLKVRSNKVFGFYIEVTHTHRDKIPENYERKQTLVNSERFITPELKDFEVKLLTAQEKANDLEYEILLRVIDQVLAAIVPLQQASAAIADIDSFAALAELAQRHNYHQPTINLTGNIDIQAGRHPVVEQLLPEKRFVPNDTHLNVDTDHNADTPQVMVITGPNMAGKSVYMRQVALITLLAHIGSFVPAQSADISLVDRIFVRSGAADMITAGLSTFMVEMVETAYILRHATPQSLIIMDEIGRGTSTYDGISLAWAIAEYLVTQPEKKAKTLFATHYHELQTLESKFPQSMKNFHMAIEEKGGTADNPGEPVFLYTIQTGGASHSYGIEVAKLAGLPDEVVKNARTLLLQEEGVTSLRSQPPLSSNLSPDLSQIDISRLTPLDALNLLAKWKGERLLESQPSHSSEATP